jgi:hypothetical protein
MAIYVGAGFYTILDFHEKYDVNLPCLIGDQRNLKIISF